MNPRVADLGSPAKESHRATEYFLQKELESAPKKDGQMKRARFTEEQIIAVLKEHEAGAKTADLARKHGISEARSTIGRPNSAAWTFPKRSG
ncbi:hypothetical protein ACVWZ4_007448 [Bradyrhizobium sp. USDA 4472]